MGGRPIHPAAWRSTPAGYEVVLGAEDAVRHAGKTAAAFISWPVGAATSVATLGAALVYLDAASSVALRPTSRVAWLRMLGI